MISPWLTQWHKGATWEDAINDSWVCNDIFRDYFTFPDNADKVRFYTTTKPTRQTYEVKLVEYQDQIIINGVAIYIHYPLYEFLTKAQSEAGETIYFGVEYI